MSILEISLIVVLGLLLVVLFMVVRSKHRNCAFAFSHPGGRFSIKLCRSCLVNHNKMYEPMTSYTGDDDTVVTDLGDEEAREALSQCMKKDEQKKELEAELDGMLKPGWKKNLPAFIHTMKTTPPSVAVDPTHK